MARLPTPGSDNNTWGTILNEYLSVTHNSDGSLKVSLVDASKLQGRNVSATAPTDGQVLTYSASSSNWQPQTPSAGSGASLGSSSPAALGTAGAGVSASASHEDHVHPKTGVAQTNNGGMEDVSTNGTAGATPAIDLANGNVHDITLTANATLTLLGATASKSCAITIIVRQDATGGRTIAWPASVKWSAGVAPVLSTAGAKVDIVSLMTVNGGTTWFGFLSGSDLR